MRVAKLRHAKVAKDWLRSECPSVHAGEIGQYPGISFTIEIDGIHLLFLVRPDC